MTWSCRDCVPPTALFSAPDCNASFGKSTHTKYLLFAKLMVAFDSCSCYVSVQNLFPLNTIVEKEKGKQCWTVCNIFTKCLPAEWMIVLNMARVWNIFGPSYNNIALQGTVLCVVYVVVVTPLDGSMSITTYLKLIFHFIDYYSHQTHTQIFFCFLFFFYISEH